MLGDLTTVPLDFLLCFPVAVAAYRRTLGEEQLAKEPPYWNPLSSELVDISPQAMLVGKVTYNVLESPFVCYDGASSQKP